MNSNQSVDLFLLQDRDFTLHPILDHFSGDPSSQAEDSFRPLIGQLAEQSSCLAADQRDSAMEQLVGQPSAHSSMIGQLPVSVGQGGWDSTLSRMIGRLSHQSGSNGQSGWQDASQLMGPMMAAQSTTWLDEVQEESQMRPLVGEPDDDQHSGVSGNGVGGGGGDCDSNLPLIHSSDSQMMENKSVGFSAAVCR